MHKKIVVSVAAMITAFSCMAVTAGAQDSPRGAIELPIIPITPPASSSTVDSQTESKTDSQNSSSESSGDSKDSQGQSGSSSSDPRTGSRDENETEIIDFSGSEADVTTSSSAADSGSHTHKFKVTKINATYTHEGYTLKTCEVCGKQEKSAVVAKKVLAAAKVTKTSSSAKTVKLTWRKVKDASGYKVYKYDSAKKKWTLAGTVGAKTLSFKVKGLKSGTSCKFRVTAFVKEGKEIAYSKPAAVKAVTKPAKVTAKSAVKKGKKVVVKWKKTTCKGYEVYGKKNGKWKKLATKKASAVSFVYKSTKVKKFKVRAFVKNSAGKKVYGSFSKVLTAK